MYSPEAKRQYHDLYQQARVKLAQQFPETDPEGNKEPQGDGVQHEEASQHR